MCTIADIISAFRNFCDIYCNKIDRKKRGKFDRVKKKPRILGAAQQISSLTASPFIYIYYLAKLPNKSKNLLNIIKCQHSAILMLSVVDPFWPPYIISNIVQPWIDNARTHQQLPSNLLLSVRRSATNKWRHGSVPSTYSESRSQIHKGENASEK